MFLSVSVSIYLLLGILYFGSRANGYNSLRDTISELGAYGSPDEKRVSYGLFLPAGVMLLFISLAANPGTALRGLSLSVAAGYLVAAFFPCDPRSPTAGSWRQQIHHLGGFAEYAGGAWYLYHVTGTDVSPSSIFYYQAAAMVVVFCTLLVSFPGTSLRGVAQRIAEVILFLGMLLLNN